MGLTITPKSKFRALQSYVLNWESIKKAYHGEPIVIAWDCINEIFVISDAKRPQYNIDFINAHGYRTNLSFFADEIDSLSEFQNFLEANPSKVHNDKFRFLREQVFGSFGSYLRYGAVTTKYIVGLLAITFMFFQLKYFGSLLIQKYQFLIKASCNQQCAETVWSITALFFYAALMTLSPLIPFLFYKKIYSAAAKSKNVQLINTSIIETLLLAVVGVNLVAQATPKIQSTTSKYSKLIASYSDGTLQAKLSQKIEMASKREFQGDIDEVETVDVLQDQREE